MGCRGDCVGDFAQCDKDTRDRILLYHLPLRQIHSSFGAGKPDEIIRVPRCSTGSLSVETRERLDCVQYSILPGASPPCKVFYPTLITMRGFIASFPVFAYSVLV